MKNLFLFVLSSILLLAQSTAQSKNDTLSIYKNAKLPIEQRINDLLSRMTVEEKVYQMSAVRLGEGDEIFKTSGKFSIEHIRALMKSHGIGNFSCPTTDMHAANSVKTANDIQHVAVEETRLGIPTIINDEALHGCMGNGSTSYPQAIALSSTWDLSLMSEIGDAIGKETYSRGTRQVLSPNLDLARDPRHGRMEETYGEDPFLSASFGVEYIKGVQKNGVICSPKHFLANFVADGGRDAGNIGFSEREFREIHFVPYKAAITKAGAKSIMAAYNAIDGVPCHANHWLLTDILRTEWGFKGFTVSDWSGVPHTVNHHHTSKDLNEAAELCSAAGLDVELPRLKCFVNLIQLIKDGKYKESEIDENVRRILRVKFEMGLFEHPFIDATNAKQLEDAPKFRQLARKAAQESVILLKNNHNILPITAQKIALIGPNADLLELGGYSANGVKGNTLLKGLKEVFGESTTITYSKGCNLTGNDKQGFADAVNAAKDADIVVMAMGGKNWTTGGETKDRIDLNLMGVQEDLINEISKTGKPIVVTLIDGRPVTMTNWIKKVDGIVLQFFGGEEGGNALAEVLAGKVNPSGKLTVTIPRNTGQLPMCLMHRAYGREGSIAEYPEVNKTSPDLIRVGRYYPLFPFGYGLSYTNYKYDSILLSKKEYKKDESVQFSINISNTGSKDGDEIVQVYLTNLQCRISQPMNQLKAFKRIHISSGETKKVDFTLNPSDFSYLNEKLLPENGSGTFELVVGTSSMEGKKTIVSIK